MKKQLLSLLLPLLAFFSFAQDGANDPTFNTFDDGTYGTGFNGSVQSTSIQPDGKIIVGGQFSSFNGTTRNRIARLNTDGSLDASFDSGTGFNSTVQSISIQPDGKIIVGGYFTSFNGTARPRIARLNTDGSLDASFDPGTGFSGTVQSTSIQPDGKIIVGGAFSFFNGTARNSIARLNTDGSLDASFDPGSGFNSTVYSISIQPDGKIIVGGQFSSFNGTTRNRIARLNTDGSLDASFNPGTGFSGTVQSTSIQPDGKIIVGGAFSFFNGTARNRIARLNTDGSLDASFDPGTGFSGTVQSTSIQPDGKIIVGGYFTSFNGTARNRIARLNTDGSLDASFDPGTGFSGAVQSTSIQPDGKIIVGGTFTTFNGTARNYIARLNTDGSLDASFVPTISGFNSNVVSTSIQPDGKIIAGGLFNTFNGTTRNYIARLNTDGSLDASFDPGTGFNNYVYSTSLQPDGKIIVGGNFTTFNGTARNSIARLNTDGSLDASFDPGSGFNSTVYSISIQPDGKIIVGGYFTSFNGTARNYIARLNSDGSLDASFNPGTGFNNGVYSTSIQPDGKIIVGGQFTTFNGTARNYIARLNADGSLDASFDPGTGFDYIVYSTSIQTDGKIIVGGYFTSFNGTARNSIARLNTDGSLDASFDPGSGFNSTVQSISIQPDGKIIVGGQFSSFNGTTRNRIARLNTDGSLDASFDPGTGFSGAVQSTSIQPDGKIIVGGAFTYFNGTQRVRIARLLNCVHATGTAIISHCGPYTWIDGNEYTTSNNTATFTISGGAANGCDSIVTLNLTIEDVLAPIANVATLADITAECSVTSLTAPTATDDCAGTVTATHNATLPITAQGTTTVTWTFDDGNGNTSTQTQNVVIEDVTAPVVPTLATITEECSATVTAPTTTDNCAGTITGTTTDPLTYSVQGTYTINWTFDDGNGNTSTQTQNVVIEDVTAPVVPTLATITEECSATVTAPTTTDNCAGTITGTTTDPLTYSVQGTYTINWTFDDGNGNTSTQTQNVVIEDVTAPVVPTLATITEECSVTVTAPTTTDNCAGTITGTTTDPLTYSVQGTYTINWTFDDGNGNTSTQTQNVVIEDVTAPVVPALATITEECSATVTAPTTTDNCAGTITGTTTDPLTYSVQGTYTINWTFDDGNGNTSTQTQNVVIEDVTAPVVPALATITEECSATVTAPTTTDNCAGTITGTTTDPLTYSVQGTYTINWTFDDGNGNTSTQTQNVVIEDVTAPVVPTLATITEECSATVTAPTTTDNCAGTITGTTTDPLTYSVQGTYTINWTFDDGNGNTSTQTQNVVIEDVTAPVVPALATITEECSATVTAPTTTDNCAGTITGTTTDPLTYSVQGTYTINWTFDDGNGNTSTQTQSVVIEDVTAPVVPTLATITEECSATVTAPTTTDNCAGTITGTTTDPLTYSVQGTYTINWTFDDGNGNTSTQTQNVVIEDVTAPVVPTLATITEECSATVTAPTTTDNCAGTITGTTTDPLTYSVQGTYTINWTFDDGNGNTSTQTQNVVIEDVTAPVVPTLATITEECSVTVTAPTTTDNCAGTITGTTTDPLTYSVQGTYTINWTFDDGNGNTSTQTQNVVIEDVTAPVVPTLATITEECSATVTAPTATDNCAGTITGTTTDPLTYSVQGTYTINWTFDDGNGNTSTQTQSVVIEDVTAPIADVATLADITAECEITSLTAPTATDNCSTTVTVTNDATLPITASTIITWTYEDGNGNTSTQTQNVVVTPIDNTVSSTGNTLTANQTGASYQWIDCDNGDQPITGETNQSFTPPANGNYAVEIIKDGCTETSDCIAVNSVGIENLSENNGWKGYPNPVTNVFTLTSSQVIDNEYLEVYSADGKLIYSTIYTGTEIQINMEGRSSGVYLLKVANRSIFKLIKE